MSRLEPQEFLDNLLGVGQQVLQQDPTEFAQLLGVYEERQPKRVLEIGTSAGATLYYWLSRATTGTLVGGIEIGPTCQVERLANSIPAGVQLLFKRGSSHDEDVKRWVAASFEWIDWLFIDANHTEESVEEDYESYGPLVRPGGVIVFHDIFVASVEVRKVWHRLKKIHETTEIGDLGGLGYGLLFVEAD